MKRFYNIVFALSLALSLPSCAYFETEAESEVEIVRAEPEPAPVEQTYLSPDYATSVALRTGGSVQVFSLDDPVVSAVSTVLAPQENIVVSTKSDRSIVVQRPAPVTFKPMTAAVEEKVDPGVRIYEWGGEQKVQVETETETESPAISTSSAAPDVESPEFVMLRSSDGSEVTIIYFDHSSVFLDDESRGKISKMAGMYNAGFMPEISVEGHASVRSNLDDPVQQRVVNLKISMDRAFAVAKALIESGVPADKVKIRAYGDTVPPQVTDGMSSESASRRVEVHEQ